MDDLRPERLLKDPAKLRQHLASRVARGPIEDASEFCELFGSTVIEGIHGTTLIDDLEAAWDYASEGLQQLERSAHTARNSTPPHESEAFKAHQRLAALILGGYQRAIEDLRGTRDPWLRKPHRLIALTRCADLLSRIALLRRQFYQDLPPGFWFSLHALLLEGERTGLLRKTMQDPLSGRTPRSLEDRYIALALFDTDGPEGIPSNEMAPLHAFLLQLAPLTCISGSPRASDEPLIHIRLEHDEPPCLEHGMKSLPANDSRLIDPGAIIRALQKALAQSGGDHLYVKDCAVMLSRSTVERCIERLIERPRRSAPRSAVEDISCVWAGRASIIHRLQQRAETPNAWQDCLDAPPRPVPKRRKPPCTSIARVWIEPRPKPCA
ncbi:MAG: hypothetical protein ACOZAQ_04970 [Pseudomonadota bacterium]